jgi:hypothetical protein
VVHILLLTPASHPTPSSPNKGAQKVAINIVRLCRSKPDYVTVLINVSHARSLNFDACCAFFPRHLFLWQKR